LEPTPKVYILLVNWNNWKDTINCLESLLQSTYTNYCIILCDNGSTDNSSEEFRFWAKNNIPSTDKHNDPLYLKTSTSKSVLFLDYSNTILKKEIQDNELKLVIIKTNTNLGFAGGSNVGLKYIIQQNDYSYIWLLNNDTIVDKNSIRNQVAFMKQNNKVDMSGSTILSLDNPNIVIAYAGGVWNPLFATTEMIGFNSKFTKNIDRTTIEKKLDYISGASMFINRNFINKVGLMEESFFLYYEEIDWQKRKGTDIELAFCPDSLIYHKGAATVNKQGNLFIQYFFYRNRMLITRKLFSKFICTVYLYILFQAH